MIKRKLTLALSILTLSSVYAASAADIIGDVAAGKVKSATCVACHGPDGNSFVPTFPKLAGQHPNYIIQQLENFKNGTRTDPVMAPMSMALTEEDRQNLAAYFSSQTIKPSPVVENSAKQGEKLYLGGNTVAGVPACSGCHGPQGKGNPASNYPAIGGQHGAYAKKQLNDYKNKTRTADNASIMTDIATKMTTGEIEAVTNYLQSLQ